MGMKSDIRLTIEYEKFASNEMLSFIKTNLTISSEEVTLYTIGTGAWTECYDTVKDFVKQSEPYIKNCELENKGNGNCADNGIHLPSLLQLEDKEFYGFSEFWYTMEDILGLGGQFNGDTFKLEATVIGLFKSSNIG